MSDREFKVGDRVRHKNGKEGIIARMDSTPGLRFAYFKDNGNEAFALENLQHIDPEPPLNSPVRTVTRQEIVPGVYGCVNVVDVNLQARVFVDLRSKLNNQWLDAEELEQVAQLVLDLAKALRENEK